MSAPKFYLKNSNSNDRQQIRLVYKRDGSNLIFGTGKSIYPQLWDLGSQRPTTDQKLISEYRKFDPNIRQELAATKNRIDHIQRTVDAIVLKMEIEGERYDKDKVKQVLSETFRNEKDQQERERETFNQYINRFIEEIESGKRVVASGKNAGNKYTKGTIKVYKNWLLQILDFQKRYKRLEWNDIDMEFYSSYIDYYHNKGSSRNYIGRQISRLKAVMNSALEEGLHQNVIYRSRSFRSLSEDSDDIALTEEEVQRFEQVKFNEDSILEKTRVAFLIMCRTGLRISDVSGIREHNITYLKDKPVLRLRTKKVQNIVNVPLTQSTLKLIQDNIYWLGSIDDSMETMMNKSLKSLGKELNLTETTEFVQTKGGKIIKSEVPKYERLKLHCGRRTALTLMYKARIPSKLIMNISGHKKESVFLKYIKMSDSAATEILLDHPYFQ